MELVRLTVVQNEIEAGQVQALLEFEGIESVQQLTNVGAGAIDAVGQGGAREILVKPDDLETARAVLGEG